MKPEKKRKIEFVMKVSKFCNLRCRYCYEYESLADRTAMSREQVRTAYGHIASFCKTVDEEDGVTTEVGFIWHGGEPLLQPPRFYWDTFADQREIFGECRSTENTVQTNLTVLDEERIALLRDGFDTVGVSVDIVGGLRVNLAGSDQQRRVIANMDVLRNNGIAFGAIVVLTRANRSHLQQIFSFFQRAGIPFRVLPLFDGAFDGQHAGYELSTRDIVDAFCTLVDLWLESENFSAVDPTHEQVKLVVRHLAGGTAPVYYNKRAWTPVVLVNTNGDCYCYGDPYGEAEWCLGNLFRSSLAEIFASSAFDRSALAAEQRMALNCTSCKWFGSCSGYPIAEEHYNCLEGTPDGARRCVVEPALYDHIERRVRAIASRDEKGRLRALLAS
jgi:uncharacterized protein